MQGSAPSQSPKNLPIDERQPLLRGRQRSENATQPKVAEEGGRSWLVVAASFFTLLVLDGTCYTFGVFMEPLRQELGKGRSEVAAVGSIQVAMYFFSGPLTARLVERAGTRPVCMVGAIVSGLGMLTASFCSTIEWIILYYAVVTGFGFGLMFIPGVVASSQHFVKRRALATGIAVCGTGVGMLALPPLVEQLLTAYDWRWAFRALACLCFLCTLCGAAMFPPPASTEEEQEVGFPAVIQPERRRGGCKALLALVLGEGLLQSENLPLFILVLIGDFLATLSLYIPYSLLPATAMAHGISQAKAAYLVSAAGISSTLGRVLAGVICDSGYLHPVTLTFLATAVAAVQSFLLASCVEYWAFLVCSSLFGLLTGAWVACETPLIIKTLRLDLLTSAFGLLTFNGGLAALAGPPLAGLAVDLNGGDNGPAFIMTGSIMAASSAIYCIAMTVNRFWNRKEIRAKEYQLVS